MPTKGTHTKVLLGDGIHILVITANVMHDNAVGVSRKRALADAFVTPRTRGIPVDEDALPPGV